MSYRTLFSLLAWGTINAFLLIRGWAGPPANCTAAITERDKSLSSPRRGPFVNRF
jgi:hypothetical protein